MIVIKVNYTTDAPIIKVNYDDAPIYISTTVDATYISVDYGSGAATNAVWGDITGTLSDQTDLQNALDDKVPYTGATGNVDLGEYELKAGQLTLDTSPTGTASVGTTRWNDTIGSSETTLKGGSVILKNGVDLVARVVNKVTPNTTLTKAAYQAVRISGAQGQRLAVAFAQANNDNNSADTIGLVTETIATNQEGFIMTVGNLEDINTTGSLQGETWADGDVLYLSPTVAGAITNIKPVAPQHLVVIGYVEYAHANHGKIYVKVMNGWELGELHDVDTTGATNGQVLKYNGTIWAPSSDLDTGITSLNGLTALSQTFATGTSGTDFNISSATSTHTFNLPTASATNRGLVSSSDWSTFNAKIGGTLATGQVAFGSAANTIAGSNNLFWDNTNGRLSIGGAGSNANSPSFIQINQSGTTVGNSVGLVVNNNTPGETRSEIAFSAVGETNAAFPYDVGHRFAAITGIVRNFSWNNIFTSGSLGFATRETTASSLVEKMRLFSTGNLLLQNGGTFTDGGQRLQVQGDAFIKGSGNTSGTTALTVQNSDGTNMLITRNDGSIFFTSNAGARIFPQISGTGVVETGTVGLAFDGRSYSGTANTSQFWFYTGNSATASTQNFIRFGGGFIPTSGTAIWNTLIMNPTINQTGGANGITRGLYVNPTLTAAADWRSIEWSNNSGWGLYGAGTAPSYHAGAIGIGTTGVDTTSAYSLRVSRQFTTVATARGIVSDAQITAGPTGVSYFSSSSSASATANVTTLRHFVASQSTFTTGAVVTTQTGFEVTDLMVGATNNYAFKGGINAGANRWNAFFDGTANNYMAGRLGLGSSTLTEINFRVSGNLSGSVGPIAVYTDGIVSSTSTTAAAYFFTSARTEAATFTLPTLTHYSATQGLFGAGSTVTTQYGFSASSGLIGATNNYGFYGNIASGTGRWNFFAAGTAANYLNGNTIIGGSAVDGGQKLQVNGTTQMTPAADTSALTVSGYSVTGSGTTPAISLTGTFNTTGAANAINVNITNTASNSASNVLRLQVGGNTIFRVQTGSIGGLGSGGPISNTGYGLGNGLAAIYTIDNANNYSTTGDAIQFSDNLTAQSGFSYIFHSGQYVNRTYTSGTGGFVSILRGFAPTSGTGVFTALNIQNTINQTGGANGITRGLYINPTLTSAADWRAIEAVSASNANHTLLKLRNATVDVFTVKADSKIGFYNATPVAQPTTAIAETAFVENSGGTAVNVDSTFAGYTLQQIAQALKDLGILA